MKTTLCDRSYGGFKGDIWVLSTSLSDAVIQYLDAQDIRYFVSDMAWAFDEMDWRGIAEIEARIAPEEAFIRYRDKRMSKLIYLEWFKRFGKHYDSVALADNDLYFQADANELFKLAENGKVNYGYEHDQIVPGTSLWNKDFHYRRMMDDWA